MTIFIQRSCCRIVIHGLKGFSSSSRLCSENETPESETV
jgi:hypothetical protein